MTLGGGLCVFLGIDRAIFGGLLIGINHSVLHLGELGVELFYLLQSDILCSLGDMEVSKLIDIR